MYTLNMFKSLKGIPINESYIANMFTNTMLCNDNLYK